MISWPLQITSMMIRNTSNMSHSQYIILENDSLKLGVDEALHYALKVSANLSLDSLLYCSHIGGKKILELAQSCWELRVSTIEWIPHSKHAVS